MILFLVRLIHLCSLILDYVFFSDIRHFKLVLNELKLFGKRNWRRFGFQAGLDYNTLHVIEANNPRDVDACFRECVASWLMRRGNVEGKPTLLRLANIVEETGDRATADGIRKQVKEKDEAIQKGKLLCSTAATVTSIILHVVIIIIDINIITVVYNTTSTSSTTGASQTSRETEESILT